MYRKRQFDELNTQRVAELYRTPHRHDLWPDHINRVQETISFARSLGYHQPDWELSESTHSDLGSDRCPCERVSEILSEGLKEQIYCPHVADLSCGDATIPRALCSRPLLGDFAPGYPLVGSIQDTIKQIPFVDVFVCTETLEHLFEPLLVLKSIRKHARRLLLSTPVHNVGDVDHNPEHYWVYDREGVESFLTEASFTVVAFKEIYNGIGYRYGTWACR